MSTSASTLAAQLNTLKNGMDRLALEIRAEYDGLPNLKVLIGDDAARLTAHTDRRTQIVEANNLHTQAAKVWTQSRDALVDNHDLVESERLRAEAAKLLEQARALFGGTTPNTGTSIPSPVPTPPATPDNGSGDGTSPAPVKGKDDKDPAPTPSPVPAPAPVQTDNQAPAWVTDLQNTVRGALESNAETIRVHVEGCNTRLNEFGQLLDELRKGTINPELAVILNTFSEDELRAALTPGNGGGSSVDVDEIKRQLDELRGQINTDDLAFLRDLRVAMEREGLTLADLIAGAKVGRSASGVVGWIDARRKVRTTPGSHS